MGQHLLQQMQDRAEMRGWAGRDAAVKLLLLLPRCITAICLLLGTARTSQCSGKKQLVIVTLNLHQLFPAAQCLTFQCPFCHSGGRVWRQDGGGLHASGEGADLALAGGHAAGGERGEGAGLRGRGARGPEKEAVVEGCLLRRCWLWIV